MDRRSHPRENGRDGGAGSRVPLPSKGRSPVDISRLAGMPEAVRQAARQAALDDQARRQAAEKAALESQVGLLL